MKQALIITFVFISNGRRRHYNMYECEASVQPSWVIPGPNGHAESYYNYSVPEFRTWWVKCAVDAVTGSQTLLDG